MPFEIPQIDAPVRIGQFQKFADAMLRGCAMTLPTVSDELVSYNNQGQVTHACAYYAIYLGGEEPNNEDLSMAYRKKYGGSYVNHFIFGRVSREAIAERIASL